MEADTDTDAENEESEVEEDVDTETSDEECVHNMDEDEIWNSFRGIQWHHLDNFQSHISYLEGEILIRKLLDAVDVGIFFLGIGKSGCVARRIANGLKSVGFPRAYFICPVRAAHGDKCAVRRSDLVVFISKSGSSKKLLRRVQSWKKKGARILSITSVRGNPIAKLSDFNVHLPLNSELSRLMPLFKLGHRTSSSFNLQIFFVESILARIRDRLKSDSSSTSSPSGDWIRKLQKIIGQ